ncbi:MAG: DUF6932 family protein [bacterium]
MEEARRSGAAVGVVINGSYATSKDDPDDIDLVLVLRSDLDLGGELRPMEYNVLSKRMARRLYGFDVRPAVDGSQAYQQYVAFFSQVRPSQPAWTTRTRKGLLRIEL